MKPNVQIGALALLAILATGSHANAAEKTIPGWAISINSNFAGTMMSYITANAVRMKFEKLGLLMIIKAPKWNALVYNDSNKNYVDLPYEHWKTKFLLRSKKVASKTESMLPEKTGKTELIQGIKAYQVLVKKKRSKDDKPVLVAEVWIAQDVKAPPQFLSMMTNLIDIPIASGTPLRVFQLNNNSRQMVKVMDCYKVNKTSVPVSDFEPLKNYHKVKDEMALMLDEGDESASDPLGTGGATDPLGDLKKPASTGGSLTGSPSTPAVPVAPPKKKGFLDGIFGK